MRDYQYIWQPSANTLILSGIEFSDLLDVLQESLLVLLKHQVGNASYDPSSRFEYVLASEVQESDDEIYSWGDFVFAVMAGSDLPELGAETIKDLLYFAHLGEWSPSLTDSGLLGGFYIHDNGWYLRFTGEPSVCNRLRSLVQAKSSDQLLADSAYLIHSTQAYTVEGTHDLDRILNSDLRRITAAQQGAQPDASGTG